MDKIVSTVYYEGTVYVFTEHGGVFQMTRDIEGNVQFRRIANLELR